MVNCSKMVFSAKKMETEMLPKILSFMKIRQEDSNKEEKTETWVHLLQLLSSLVPKLPVEKWKLRERTTFFTENIFGEDNISLKKPLPQNATSDPFLSRKSDEASEGRKEALEKINQLVEMESEDSKNENESEQKFRTPAPSLSQKRLFSFSSQELCYQMAALFIVPQPAKFELFVEALYLYVKSSIQQTNLLPFATSYLTQFVVHLTQVVDLFSIPPQRLVIYLTVLDCISLIWYPKFFLTCTFF